MSSQIVFLFDLDQCLPLEQGLNNDDLDFLVSKVKDICLKIISSASHFEGPNGVQNVAHFSFRFYSSSAYFMVPDQHEGKFLELSETTFSSLETALGDRFEALLQTSKTNSFDALGLQQHMKTSNKAHFQTLQKALQEISILYHWDRPLLNSPVKFNDSKNSSSNSVYIFTKLPNTNDELCQFMGKPKVKRRFNHKDIYDKLFLRSMTNVFKGDALIKVNVIDTSYFRNIQFNEEVFKVKNEFKKCFGCLHGNVIPVKAFTSKNCDSNYVNPNPTSVILRSYDDYPKESRQEFELKIKDQIVKLYSSTKLASHFQLKCYVPKHKMGCHGIKSKALLWPRNEKLSQWSHFLMKNQYVGIFENEENIIASLSAAEDSLFQFNILEESYSKLTKLILTRNESFEKPLETSVELDLTSLFKQKCPQVEASKESKTYFNGSIFESWNIPDSNSFTKFIDKVKNQKQNHDSELMKNLKKSYLPHMKTEKETTIRRKTSEESVSSTKSSGKTNRSRGAELMRLGSKNAELRRSSHEDPKDQSNRSVMKSNKSLDENAKEQFKQKFIQRLNQTENEQQLLRNLINIQLEMLDHGENAALAAFAEIVVSKLLEHANVSKSSSFDDLVSGNFLVDPGVVSKRRSNKAVRIRDHKLQVLLRIEFHFYLPNQERQRQVEEEMLAHLRQISIWDSPNEMLTFLQEILTPFYIQRQPELLCFLYEELNQPPPPGFSALFSPFKRSEMSSPVDPSSIASDVSYVSANDPASWKIRGNSQPEVSDRLRKMRKIGFEKKPMMQIDLSKGDKTKNASKKEVKKQTPRRGRNQSVSSKKTPQKRSQGVRRNLTFDDRNVTPKKKPTRTPKKSQESKTPCKMTPGKKHQILVPETPTGKNGRRKSDGTQVVKESPNIDALKQESTPRALQASLLLKSKTSFYSGDVSRNLMAAEEQINARHLQSFNTSLPLPRSKRGDSASQMLFPFMEGRRRRCSSSSSKTPKKQNNDAEQRSMRRLFIEDAEDTEIVLKSPFKSPPSRASPRVLFSPEKQSKTPKKKLEDLMQNENILETPSKPEELSKTEPSEESSTLESRPSRRKKFVERMGIDDVKLSTQVKTPKKKLEDLALKENLLETPSPSKPVELSKTEEASEELSTPESRPSRRKKFVERMGIDDIKLSTMFSPRVCISPFQRHNHRFKQDEEANVEEIVAKSQNVDPFPSVKRVSLKTPLEVPMIRDLKRKREESEREETEEIDYKSEAVDSPNGEIKLRIKINRTLKPVTTNCQRISRRASNQLGITPENLLLLQTRSPSPLKKLHKENIQHKFSPLSSTSLFNLTTSPILNVNLAKERRPAKDSPSRKRRRVSKKLYD